MIDTHTHLFSPKFDSDRKEVVERAIASGVERMYLPNIDVDSVDSMLVLAKAYPGHCFPMLGLHPTSVDSNFKAALEQLIARKEDHAWSAIGEIGTDLYWSDKFWKEQQEAFVVQCEWALDMDLPIVVHCRNSIDQTLDLVQPFVSSGLRGVFHCFSGTIAQAKRAVDFGFYLGIGGVLTYKKNGDLPDVVNAIPTNRLLLETDSPYLAPVPKRGKRNESSYIVHVLERLAQYMDRSKEEVEKITSDNARQLFG